jgi:hypothetical protein
MSLSTVSPHPMSTYGCSVVPAIPTSPPKHLINWHSGPSDVPSSDILPITKTIGVSISPPITHFPFAVSPHLTNDLDIFLHALLTVPRHPPKVLATPRRWRSHHYPRRSDRTSVAIGPHRCRRFDHRPRRSDHASTATGPR